jgi:putative oxidoreductase
MKSIARARPDHSTPPVVIRIRPRVDSRVRTALSIPFVSRLDELLLTILHRWSITALRVALGLVFVWFGALKGFGISPVRTLIQETYSFLPIHPFLLVLGAWEMLVGIGIIVKRALRCVLILLSIHLAGTFVAVLLNPRHFFVQGFPLCLTAEGEFVVKNLVLMAAGLVIAGYEIKPLRNSITTKSISMKTEEEVV